jgi:uncharacterized protein
MLKSKHNRELSEADFDWLNTMLSRVGGGLIPNVEALDGFMTAIVVCPDLIMPSEYVRVIASGKTEDEDLVFESPKEVERFYASMTCYYDEISDVFRRGEPRMPYLAQDGEEISGGNDWASGFLTGTRLRHDLWREVVNDEERAGSFVPIWALAYEHDEDPSMRPYDHPVSPELREELIVGVTASVTRLYATFREERSERRTGRPLPRSSARKTGRNDPCPCGSGKKFKACCAQLTFH